jgi:transcriptional regulator with XRE-family HTH domain
MTGDTGTGALNQYYREYEYDPDFIAEHMAMVVVEDALGIMQGRGLTRTNLANTLGVSKAQVSRLFNAPPNLTLRSVARLAVALGVKPFVGVGPVEKSTVFKSLGRETLFSYLVASLADLISVSEADPRYKDILRYIVEKAFASDVASGDTSEPWRTGRITQQ